MGVEDGDDDDFKPQRVAPISVTSTISRYSLGMPHYTKFDSSIHSKSDPDYKWHAEEGAFIIDNRVTWYIRKVSEKLHRPLEVSSTHACHNIGRECIQDRPGATLLVAPLEKEIPRKLHRETGSMRQQ